MKFSALFLAMIASAQAFAPVQIPTSNVALRMSGDDDGNILEKAGDAVRDAMDRMDGADNVPAPGQAVQNGLSDKKEQDMWDAQRELQANRNAHSSKDGRKEKYSGAPIAENDKTGEVNNPWTKSDKTEDHNSAHGSIGGNL